MGFQMSFDDPSGVSHPESYWAISSIHMDRPGKTLTYTFLGFRSATTRQGRKQPVQGGVRNYVAAGATYDNYYTRTIGRGGPNLPKLGYELARTTKDVEVAPGVWESFFEHATDVFEAGQP